MSDLVVYLPSEKRKEPSSSAPLARTVLANGAWRIAWITCEALPSPDLQALLADAIMPLAESSITKRSLGMFGIVMFILFGNLFFKSPLITIPTFVRTLE